MDLGCLGIIDQEDGLIAYFEEPFDPATIDRMIVDLISAFQQTGIDVRINARYEVIPPQDWNSAWKAGFKPLDIGEHFTILPPWEEPRAGRINLVIDPGMAFGTGHHETTRSCLILMERLAKYTTRDRFLDLGTGTGLLAIAAARLGYRRVTAIDNDPEAIEAARKNFELNAITSIELIEGDIFMATGTFDLIAANLISGALICLAGEIASRLNRSGVVILSGILLEQGEEVILAMSLAGLALRERLDDGKWTSLIVGKAGDQQILSA
jgi:ribosomal protein L11 methyltransferase